MRSPSKTMALWLLLIVMAVLIFQMYEKQSNQVVRDFNYGKFLQAVESDEVVKDSVIFHTATGEIEGQLNDERVRWLGVKSPGAAAEGQTQGREAMSVMVLRQEFKKMMREVRGEGVKLVRVCFNIPVKEVSNTNILFLQAEQEERRRLEAELRKMRQSNGVLGRTTNTPVLNANAHAPAGQAASPSLAPAHATG